MRMYDYEWIKQPDTSILLYYFLIFPHLDNTDAILAQRPDGRVACLKCIDEQGCHKTFSRKDVAKLHFKKVHGPC